MLKSVENALQNINVWIISHTPFIITCWHRKEPIAWNIIVSETIEKEDLEYEQTRYTHTPTLKLVNVKINQNK